MPTLNLNGFSFPELQSVDGLKKLDTVFLTFLNEQDKALHQFLLDYRNKRLSLISKDISQCLIEVARQIEIFLSQFYGIGEAVNALQLKTIQFDPIYLFKKEFVLKRAKRQLKKTQDHSLYPALTEKLIATIKKNTVEPDLELAFAQYALKQLTENNETEIEAITLWCILSIKQPTDIMKNWISFKIPKKIDFQRLIAVSEGFRKHVSSASFEQRDGFDLTDQRMSMKQVQNEVHYCVYCHEKDDDFCSKGFPQSKKKPEEGFRKNPLDVTLAGCPLDEKISEMHLLKKTGNSIAALAMIMLDNPMCPATGHRICNDCMKACIYQKQEPVNIPEIETTTLTDVLHLPWGVEIYDLLTRWNPLRQEQFIPKPYNHYKILIAGLGPAGFTMAYYLLMEGCHVTGFDGLKIESLAQSYIDNPIYDYESITESLDERMMTGFGGVAEYGITVRWDKNFLKLIYITLMRRKQFQAIGNVRFGGTITIEDTQRLGFDHLCIAVGAGLPKALPIPGSLAPGMRQANDFLMALQLTGALKKESLANLQIRMPMIVVGGGLTGVDAATEAQAYYIRQVEKTSLRYNTLCQLSNEANVRKSFTAIDLEILDEHLLHADLVKKEREVAAAENRSPDFIRLIHAWGGVSIVYRRTMQESPAYVSNHEELQKALDQGLFYIENAWPISAALDKNGHISGLLVKVRHHDKTGEWHKEEEKLITAKTILVATGAKLNIAYSFEHKDVLMKENGHYIPHEFKAGKLEAVPIAPHCKSDNFGPFTSYDKDKRLVSFIGDSHPAFHGNVVKAIASAKQSYPKIIEAIQSTPPCNKNEQFNQFIKEYFQATVTNIENIAEGIVSLTVQCKAAVKNFKPGQFFRVQNYETQSTESLTEAIALSASQVDYKKHCVSFTILDKGLSSEICKRFQIGDPIAIMGPAGVRSKVDLNENILIIGNALAVIQAQILQQYCKDKQAQLTLITNEKRLPTNKEMTIYFTSDFQKQLNEMDLSTFHKILIIGDNPFIKSMKQYKSENQDKFKLDAKFYAAAYAPMQCMLKGVCAQCLVWQKDPETGQRKKAVYACSWQHQPLSLLDLDNLAERLSQNSMQETLATLTNQAT